MERGRELRSVGLLSTEIVIAISRYLVNSSGKHTGKTYPLPVLL